MKITALPCYILMVVAPSVCLADSAATASISQRVTLGAERIGVDQLGISLCLPAGWHIQTLDGPAARLVPTREAQRQVAALGSVVDREIELWPIELVVWTSPAVSHSPQQAVAGHEQLLRQRYNYERENSKPFTTAFGLSGIVVTGRIATGEDTLLVVFAGYTISDHNVVIGTFCRPADREIIAGLLQPLIRSVGPLGATGNGTSPPLPTSASSPRTDRPEASAYLRHPQTVTVPPSAASPSISSGPDRTGPPPQPLLLAQTGREPSIPTSLFLPEPGVPAQQQPIGEAPSPTSTVHMPPHTEPVSVPSPPPEAEQRSATTPTEQVTPGPWVEHVLPAGITLPTPVGWSARVDNGVLYAYGPEKAEGIMVCPLFSIPSIPDLAPSADKDAEAICQYWQQLIGHSFTASSHLSIQRSGQVFEVFSGTLTLGDDTAHAIVTIAVLMRLLNNLSSACPDCNRY